MNVDFFSEKDSTLWDDFVLNSHKSTFQHSRRFLNYHKDRFFDRSVIVKDRNKLIAIFPAVENPKRQGQIVSHAGATYGGLIYNQSVYGEKTIAILSEIKSFYRSQGYREIVYKATPSLYQKVSDEDDIYALFRIGAKLDRVDINVYVNLKRRLKVSSQRKRSLKRSKKNDVSIIFGNENLLGFYTILSENLKSKYKANPVHSFEELIELNRLFPDVLELCVAKDSFGNIISGVLFFRINDVIHAQYIASSDIGYELGGLDLIFETALGHFDTSYLAFGTSNENHGEFLNQSLYRFKRQFGSVSVAHMFFNISCSDL